MDEFALIRRYFAGLTSAAEGVVLGIGDDCALLDVPPQHHLAVSTDSLVAGRHFPLDTLPADIGWKSLAVSLSDLAAMGAQPLAFTLALTLERADESWLEEFSRGLGDLARLHGIALIGGDTTRGPLNVNVTAMGIVPVGAALRRDGARPGDAVCVTGTLGDAALALKLGATAADPFLQSRLDRPTPRVAAGLALRQAASAAIDLSDGLAGDLAHILEASKVGAEIRIPQLPASEAFSMRLPSPTERLPYQLCGGDDYELCVCIPADRIETVRSMLEVRLTVIGCITSEPGLRFIDAAGATIAVPLHGYRHFE